MSNELISIHQELSAYYAPVYWHGQVALWKHTDRDEFAVVYGKQVKDLLTYTEAARELGECLMHQLVCEGKIELDRS